MDNYGFSVDQITEMVMEYQLSIGVRIRADNNCECPSYLIRRREILFPEFLKEAQRQGVEPAVVVSRFAYRLHKTHERNASKGVDSSFARNVHEFEEFRK